MHLLLSDRHASASYSGRRSDPERRYAGSDANRDYASAASGGCGEVNLVSIAKIDESVLLLRENGNETRMNVYILSLFLCVKLVYTGSYSGIF